MNLYTRWYIYHFPLISLTLKTKQIKSTIQLVTVKIKYIVIHLFRRKNNKE